MFRNILVLLLINASYRSLGFPLDPSAPVVLVNSLTALASDCENAFLVNQIKAKLANCTVLPRPHAEKQLQCLVFYDINKQLCTAVAAGKISLPEDYTAKIQEEQDVNSLCVSAKDWTVPNLTEFPHYKQAVDKVFKHTVTCGKVCGVEDFMSDEANFFCKYYKWGTDVLKQAIITSTQSTVSNSQLSPASENSNKDESAPASNDLQDVQIKESPSTIAKSNIPTSSALASETQPKVDIKPETTSVVLNEKSQSVEPGTMSNVGAVPEIQANADRSIGHLEDTGAMPENANEENDPSKSTEGVANKVETVQGSITKAKAEDTPSKPDGVKKTEESKTIQELNSELDTKQPVLETPKGKLPPSEIQDYQDSEEGKDMQGDDDAEDGDGEDVQVGDFPPEGQKPAQKAETVISTFPREKEVFYANPVQNAYSDDDDDHFLTFFLTAIVLLVLVYVVYHNKHKVAKMFYGLVVEGRQATRRRNSRGHSYRRLDTLEQAMSASSAAPPSKIIY